MIAQTRAILRRRPIVGTDQGDAVSAAPPRIPYPREVGDAVGIGKPHEAVQERVSAVVLSNLARDDRDLLPDGLEHARPARRLIAAVLVVDVEGGDQGVRRVPRLVSKPLAPGLPPREAAENRSAG